MGHPMIVASRYQPQQYLIGPTLFPMYLYVLRLTMLWAFVICMIVTVVVTPLTTPGAKAIFESLLRMPGILIQTAAWITLVFAALDFFRGAVSERVSDFHRHSPTKLESQYVAAARERRQPARQAPLVRSGSR